MEKILRAEETKDENGLQPPLLHDDPDESDNDDEEMLGDFKEVLENKFGPRFLRRTLLPSQTALPGMVDL